MEYHIRPCTQEDVDALSLVGQATFLEAFAGVLEGRDIIAHCLRQHSAIAYQEILRANGSCGWLVEMKGAPVGYAIVQSPDLPVDLMEGDVELKRIYLLGSARGNGLGAKLLEKARAFTSANGGGRLLLGVYKGNTSAIEFYRKTGFHEIGERLFRVGDNSYADSVLMLRTA
ncbi:MAG: N-acetyltransferase [Pseudomonadota bacterium]